MPPEQSDREDFEDAVESGGAEVEETTAPAEPVAEEKPSALAADEYTTESSLGDVVDEDEDWSNFAAREEEQEEPAPVPTPEPVAEAQPAEQETAPEPEPTTEEQAPVAEEPSPEPQVQDWNQVYADRIGQLAEFYKFGEEDAEKVVTDPTAILPMLAARVQAATEYSVMQMIGQQMPHLLDQINQQQRQHDAARANFYKPYPQLLQHITEHPEAEQTVINMRQTYMQNLPEGYDRNRADKEVAMAAIMAFGLSTEQQQQLTAPAPVSEPQTVNQPPRGGTPNQPSQPVGVAPHNPQPVSPYEQLDQEFEETGSAALY